MDPKVVSVAFLVVLSVALAPTPASGQVYCPPGACASVLCQQVSQPECEANGKGKYVAKGDACECCPICITFLDEGSECFLIADSPNTRVCREPMFCINQRCSYPTSN